MKHNDPELSEIKKAIRALDLQACRFLASWLDEHIRLLEINKLRSAKSIKELGLTSRAYNVLTGYGIRTIDQLLAIDWDDVKIMKGAGNVVVEEIQKKIADRNVAIQTK